MFWRTEGIHVSCGGIPRASSVPIQRGGIPRASSVPRPKFTPCVPMSMCRLVAHGLAYKCFYSDQQVSVYACEIVRFPSVER